MRDSRIAIITGAGSGIGSAAALVFAAAGWHVALVGRRAARLQETVAQIRRLHPEAETQTLAIDIASADAPKRIVSETVDRWGRIDALVNNAAVLFTQPIDQASDQAIRQSFEINAIAPLRLGREVWPIMLKQRSGGRIVNISSISASDPFPGLGAYGMTKCAIEGLTHAVNAEGRSQRIIAFSLVLGAVETEMLRQVVSKDALTESKTMNPADVAKVIVECASGQRDEQANEPIVMQPGA